MSSIRNFGGHFGAVLSGLGLTMATLAVSAADVPLSNVASPEVYKVLAENASFRVVMATWQPGQRDTLHSHPANAVYRLTDCKTRVYDANGKVMREGEVKGGTVNLQEPIVAHSLENIGNTVCQMVIVERK